MPKGYPLETISDHFGGTGGNFKTLGSRWRNRRFHGLRGSPGTSFAALCEQRFSMWFSQRFVCDLLPDLGSKRGPRGGPTKDPRANFFDSAPLGDPLGRPGSPNDPQGY